jgi:hypothetical protein
MNKLYKKLLSLRLLKRAWHLARSDSRTDFIYDPYKYGDYAYNLEENLKGLLISLKQDTYHPQPVLQIDVPKSSLAVRPGSTIEIEDRIVLFAITCLIAPDLDKKLPSTVYSYRLKKGLDKDSLFREMDIIEFPFLKKQTIQKEIQVFEPWYEQWPIFMKESIYAYEKEGYNRLSVSDISAYFENINFEILRDILLQELPKEQRIINLLISILEHWVWKTHDGRSIGRGLPQGNSVSSFLANIYLLPLDRAFIKFAQKHDIKYFRYMDDVKIFSKFTNNEATARQAIFGMNEALRYLHLNMQGSKTDILRDEEIREDIEDDRLTRVNECIDEFHGEKITRAEKRDYVKRLKTEYKKIKSRKKALKNKDLRLFRRILTGFTLLQDGALVDRILLEIERNPDFKLMSSAVKYLRVVQKKQIIRHRLFEFLESPVNIFALQEALILLVLRYLKEYEKEIINYSKKVIKSKTAHWYIRSQAYLLLAQVPLSQTYLKTIRRAFEEETNIEVKRAMIAVLMQINEKDLKDFLNEISFDPNPKVGRIGRMLVDLQGKYDSARNEINNILKDFNEIRLMDNLYRLETIKYHADERIRELLMKRLKAHTRRIRKPVLKKRIENILVSIRQ